MELLTIIKIAVLIFMVVSLFKTIVSFAFETIKFVATVTLKIALTVLSFGLIGISELDF